MAHILIVDDEPVCAELAAIICKAAGHTVALASNGIEALVLLDGGHFDLVISDALMPLMGGLDLTRSIRSAGTHYANVPIIGVTARAGARDVEALRDAGMTHVLTKPLRNAGLLNAVTHVLANADTTVLIYRVAPVRRAG